MATAQHCNLTICLLFSICHVTPLLLSWQPAVTRHCLAQSCHQSPITPVNPMLTQRGGPVVIPAASNANIELRLWWIGLPACQINGLKTTTWPFIHEWQTNPQFNFCVAMTAVSLTAQLNGSLLASHNMLLVPWLHSQISLTRAAEQISTHRILTMLGGIQCQ